MTKLLEHAIARARELSDEDQDMLAVALLSMASDGMGVGPLDDETRAAIREGLEEARGGEFVSGETVAALWRRFGV